MAPADRVSNRDRLETRCVSSRRDRVIAGVTDLAARYGFGSLTTDVVLDAARVSRTTFYQYFTSVHDCAEVVYRVHADEFLRSRALAVRAASRPDLAALEALVELAVDRPAVARILMLEGLALSGSGRNGRDDLIRWLADAAGSPRAGVPRLDLPAPALLGAAMRFLGMRLLSGSVRPVARDELLHWARSFERRPGEPSWAARLAPTLPRQLSAPRQPIKIVTPPRERILRAAAATVCREGYRQATVAEIVACARVSRRFFYNQFDSKADALTAAYEHGFRDLIGDCAPAFFDARHWPERVWHAGLAFTAWVTREPCLAHLGFVEYHAVGAPMVALAHEKQLAFTLFLEEGYRQADAQFPRPRATSELTAMLVMELAFRAVRRGATALFRSLQPLAVHAVLTPFIGADAAGSFVEKKIAAVQAPRDPVGPLSH
jgi:AcrR family transcriptional regulator